jgi:subtilase family serine protease
LRPFALDRFNIHEGESMGDSLGRRAAIVLGVAALVLPFMTGAATAAPTGRVTVPGSTPTWAQPSAAVGTPVSSSRMTFTVALPLHDTAGAEALATNVTNPSSAAYGRYLTPAAFNAQFGPRDSSLAKVKNFLTGQGIAVLSVADGNRWVRASGTVAQIDAVFGTTMKTYNWRGMRLSAPATPVNVPADVAADVLAVGGLTQTPARSHAVRADDAGATGPLVPPDAAAPCSTYWNQYQQSMPEAYGRTSFPTSLCGYTPAQLRGAYGIQPAVSSGRNGNGVTVAIIDAYASPTMLADADVYSDAVGEPRFKPGQYTETVFGPFQLQDECGDWSTEESLDVEAAHGMAPGANVHYFGAADCGAGIDDPANYIVQHHSADIVSNSYGWDTEELPPAEVNLEHSIYLQAALEGIGFYFSSGDNLALVGADAPGPSYASSDPLVTAVGGTSLAIDKHNGYQFETGWGSVTDFVDSSGTTPVYSQPLPGVLYQGVDGGVSTLFAEPFYQRSKVPASLTHSGGKPMRAVPDIAADADPDTGFLFGQTVSGQFMVGEIGGTSLACPLIAGVQADASTHRRFPIGFANPLLYRLSDLALRDVAPAQNPVAVSRFSGNFLVTFDQGTTLATTRGYDSVTGLGTPLGLAFLSAQA